MRFPFFRNRDSVKNGILISIRRTGDGFHPGLFTKIPSSNKVQKLIENLESELAATVREKQEFQKKQKTLDIIKQNFTALLNAPEMQVPVSGKELAL